MLCRNKPVSLLRKITSGFYEIVTYGFKMLDISSL